MWSPLYLTSAFLIFPYLIHPPASENTYLGELPEDGGFIDIQGNKIFYRERGNPKRPTVLLIHGLCSSSFSWRQSLKILPQEGFHVIAVDLNGFGFSSKLRTADYSHSEQARVLQRIVRAKKITSISVVGHSMGASVALHLAQIFPFLVDKIILVGGAVYEDITFRHRLGYLLRFPPLARWARLTTEAAVRIMETGPGKRILKKVIVNQQALAEELLQGYAVFRQTRDWDWGIVGTTRDSYKNALPKQLATVHQPVVLLYGDQDQITPLEIARRLNDRLSNSTLEELYGMGHIPMEDDPDRFNRILIKHLTTPAAKTS